MEEVHFMPHQLDAIYKLHSGNILCGGVGTGKSITALGWYYIRVCGAVCWTDGTLGPMVRPKPLYIITTARKRDTKEWERECDRFDMEGVQITIDSWNNIGKYEGVNGAVFLFDEQRVVGRGTWVRYFLKLSKANQWLLLTATPGDNWSDYIPVFIANGFYKNRTAFIRRHAVFSRYCTKYPKIEKWLEVGYLESLRRRITVVMDYKKKTIPVWKDIEVEYDSAKYQLVAKERWNPYEETPIQDISGVCYLMRRVANENESRLNAVKDILKRAPRAIIFYNFDYELEILRTLSDIIPVKEWNGHNHEALPDSERWAYLVQYAAGAEGWNCVETDTIIFYSLNYSYKMMQQAAGRIDRLNTPYTYLHYYVLKSSASIDAAISRALKNKRNFNEKLFIGIGKT